MSTYTLKFQPAGEQSGWTSFFSFFPDWMVNMNNYLYTFKNGEMWKHNINASRNNFYGTVDDSKLVLLFNEEPTENKMFKTIEFNGNVSWNTLISTDMDAGFMETSFYTRKENTYYSNIVRPIDSFDLRYLSADGIGSVASIVSLGGGAYRITMNQPLPASLTQNQDLFTINTNTNEYYKVSSIASIDVATNSFTISYILTLVAANSILFTVKNPQAESYGVRGHYMQVELSVGYDTPVELFSVSSEVFQSYP